MGRYNDLLRNHQRVMQQYSYMMDDTARTWNENKLWTLQLKAQ